MMIYYIHMIRPIRWAVIKLLSVVITGEWLTFVLLVYKCNYTIKGREMQPYCETKETFQSPSGNLEREIKVPSLSWRKD